MAEGFPFLQAELKKRGIPPLITNRISVAGLSRRGKSALLAAAFDERFTCSYADDSGCSGDALSRGHRQNRVIHH